MKAKLRRIYAAVMALAITISLVTVPVQAAEAPQFSDVDGHWGEEAIVRWADYGVIEGSNGQFNPDAPITRAEMAAVIARLLGLTETAENTFTDVEAGAWYAQAILQCAAAGIIQGSNGMANPNGTLTRQEAAVMLGRALGIQPDEGDVAFLDGEQVAGWAAGYVSAMSDRGILSGVGGNQFAPLEDINRASVVTVLNNAVTAYANEPGATVQASGGIALVVAEDVTVTGTAEDVLIVAGGDVTVAADVSGSVTVSAEGADVTVAENAVVGTVAVSGGSAAVTVEADASVSTLAVAESASGASVTVAADAAVETVTVAAPESSVTVSGSVGAVEAAETAGNADITVGADATVDSIATAAAGTDITVSGTVETVTVADTAGETTITANNGAQVGSVTTAGAGTSVEANRGAAIDSVTTTGADTTVSGSGTVTAVEAAEGSTGASVTTSGTTVENNSSESVTTGTGSVAAGDTATTTRPSSGGGSSSGGSSGHSHSYTDGVCSCGAYDPAWRQVNSVETWNAAITAGAQNIVITGDFAAATQLTVTRAAAVVGTITINGNGKTITSENNATNAGDAAGILVAVDDVVVKNLTVSGPNNTPTTWDEGEYGIKVYGTSDVTLQDVTVTKANAGIQVNSAAVTLAGTVTVSGNEWGGIEVCKSENAGMTAGTLTIGEGATVVCTDTDVPTIWIDGTTEYDGVVNGAGGMIKVTMGSQIYYYPAGTNITITGQKTISADSTVENLTVAEGATLTVAENVTLTVTGTLTVNGTLTKSGTIDLSDSASYSASNENGLSNAIELASDGDTISVTGEISLENPITISKDITIDGKGTGKIKNKAITVKADVTFKNLALESPTNTNSNASHVYVQDGCENITFEGVTFNDPQWEAMQITSKDLKELVVKNCTFTAANVNGAESSYGNEADQAIRYIHVQPKQTDNVVAAMTITNNVFEDCDNVKDSIVGIFYIAEGSTLKVGNNKFSGYSQPDINVHPSRFCFGWPAMIVVDDYAVWQGNETTYTYSDPTASAVEDVLENESVIVEDPVEETTTLTVTSNTEN